MHTQPLTRLMTNRMTQSHVGFSDLRILLETPQADLTGKLDLGLWEDTRTNDILLADYEGLFRSIPGTASSIVPGGVVPIKGTRVIQNLWPAADNSDTPTTKTFTVIAGAEYQLRIGSASASGATAVLSGAFTGTLTGDASNVISFVNGVPKTASSTSLTVTISGAVVNIQIEDVTGQVNQNPSEYVKRDTVNNFYGFAYYATEKRNTVDGSGVVTEVVGAALRPAIKSLIGIGDSIMNDSGQGRALTTMGEIIGATSVTNSGVGGQQLPDIAARFEDDVVAFLPDVVIIQGGINDINAASSDPTAAMISNVQSMLAQSQAAGIYPIVVLLSPEKAFAGWTTDKQTWSDSYNSQMEILLAASGIKYVNPYSFIEDQDVPDTLEPNYDSGDGLHWNVAGQYEMGRAYAQIFGSSPYSLVHVRANTNLITQSNPVNWPSFTGLSAQNVTVGPVGALSALEIVEDTSTGIHRAQAFNTLLGATTTYRYSVFVKRGVDIRNMFIGGWYAGDSKQFNVIWRPDTKDFTQILNVDDQGYEQVGAFTRIWIDFTTVLAGNLQASVNLVKVNASSYTGDGVSSIVCAQAQIEVVGDESRPQEPITTVGSAVTRDTCGIRHPRAGYFNQAAFTIVFDHAWDVPQTSLSAADEGLAAVQESATSLLFADSGGFKSTDGTNTPFIDPTFTADNRQFAVVHGALGDNFQVSEKDIYDTGFWVHGTPQAYDGVFAVGSWINLGYGNLHNLVIHSFIIYGFSMTIEQIEALHTGPALLLPDDSIFTLTDGSTFRLPG